MAHARDGRRCLAELLGDPPPPALEGMDAADLDAFAETVLAARRHQRKQLERALEDALAHLPALLRGPVRKILFP